MRAKQDTPTPTHRPATPAVTVGSCSAPSSQEAKRGETRRTLRALWQAPKDTVCRRCPINANRAEPKAHAQAARGEGKKWGPH